MKYKSLICWYDKDDDLRLYRIGDEYPREGRKATKSRIKALTDQKIISKEE